MKVTEKNKNTNKKYSGRVFNQLGRIKIQKKKSNRCDDNEGNIFAELRWHLEGAYDLPIFYFPELL